MERKVKEEDSSKLRQILENAEKSWQEYFKSICSSQPSTSLTIHEAMCMIIDKDFKVDTYESMRRLAIEHGRNLYPAYQTVAAARMLCKPPEEKIKISDMEASVLLQCLLDHTAGRILALQEEHLKAYCSETGSRHISLTLDATWGFDGDTGKSNYKQRFSVSRDDNSILTTVLIPLAVASKENQSHILWKNPTPQSVRYCRPLRVHVLKDDGNNSIDVFHQSQVEGVNQEIENLQAFSTKLNETSDDPISVTLNYNLRLTDIDGKFLSANRECSICKARSVNTNQIQVADGVSPLHCWIKFYEFCLQFAYRNCNGLRTMRVTTEEMKTILNVKQRHITEQISEKLGLTVDIPVGQGKVDEGYSARRAFAEHQVFAEILGLEPWLTEDLNTILCAISCEFPLDESKFEEFCTEALAKYLKKCYWFNLPPTVHRILAHGGDIIKGSVLPLGMLSEQCGQKRGCLSRQYREFNTYEPSRTASMKSVFYRSLEASDPVVANWSIVTRKRMIRDQKLPETTLSLLSYDPKQLASRDDDDDEDMSTEGESLCPELAENFEETLEDMKLGIEPDMIIS